GGSGRTRTSDRRCSYPRIKRSSPSIPTRSAPSASARSSSRAADDWHETITMDATRIHRFPAGSFATSLILLASLAACGGGRPRDKDPHVVPNTRDFEENPKFNSRPTLGQPIYACSSNVTITNFLKGATLNVLINGSPAPNPSVVGQDPEVGVNFNVGTSFTAGQVVTVTQTFNGATSAPSNAVPVTSHTEHSPMDFARPFLSNHPLGQWGHAVLVEAPVPGERVTTPAENPAGPGTFGPPATVGGFSASTNWGLNWSGVSPQFELHA